MTRWQGTTIDSRLSPLARPTARTAEGEPMRRASSAYEHVVPAGIVSSAFHTRDWKSEPVSITGVSNTCRTGKVFVELALDLRQVSMLAGQRPRTQSLLQRCERALEAAPVDEVEQVQAT